MSFPEHDFDLGIVAGTTCLELFHEEVEKHPGARKLLAIHNMKCTNEKGDCGRYFVQACLEDVAGGDMVRAADFLNRLDIIIHEAMDYDTILNLATRLIEQFSPRAATPSPFPLLSKILGGSAP